MLLSLDISTSCTGYSIFSSDNSENKLELIDAINLSKHKSFYDKTKFIKQRLSEIKEKYNITAVAVEENLQAFRPGLSSAKTLMTLAQFNGVVRWICLELFEVEPESINVNAARKSIGLKVDKKSNLTTKDQVLNWVKSDQPDLDWPMKTLKSGRRKGQIIVDPTSYDMADSYVIGKAYFNLK